MIGRAQLERMRPGSYLLNLSRGSVVDIAALGEALRSRHLAGRRSTCSGGTELEPRPLPVELCGLDNVILTPHIGGSTEEAQRNIGLEVSEALRDYALSGISTGCANLPEVQMPKLADSLRVLNIHKDVPGVLSRVNGLVAGMGVNIKAQSYHTRDGIGYLIMDAERTLSRGIGAEIAALDSSIRTRILNG